MIMTAASFLPFDLLHDKLLLEDHLLECKLILHHFSLIRNQAIHPLLVTWPDPIVIRVVKLGIMMLLMVSLYAICMSHLMHIFSSELFLSIKTTSFLTYSCLASSASISSCYLRASSSWASIYLQSYSSFLGGASICVCSIFCDGCWGGVLGLSWLISTSWCSFSKWSTMKNTFDLLVSLLLTAPVLF